MRIKLKYPDVDTFIQKYAVNISRGGIFIATKQPKPVGTRLRFEFLLANAETTSIIRGDGTVQWTREFDPEAPTRAHGMGVKFTRLDTDSQALVERALAWRASQSAESGPRRIDSGIIPIQQPTPPGATPEPVAIPSAPASQPPGSALPETMPLASLVPPPVTREVVINDAPPRDSDEDEETLLGRPRDVVTREIQMPDLPPREDQSGEIELPALPPVVRTRVRHARVRDELDELCAEWGLTAERLDRVLSRARPRMVEATAELERLLRKPPKGPVPSKAEAIAQIDALLASRSRAQH